VVVQEELELPYEIKKYQRGPDHLALRELYTVGKSPAITDGDLVLAESGAIVGESSVIRHVYIRNDCRTYCKSFRQQISNA